MGFFRHKKTERKVIKSPDWPSSLEECEQETSRCEQEISHIERKKRDLERRLEILSQAKPSRTVFLTDDPFPAPTTVVEDEIQLIMNQLRRLDLELDLKEESFRRSKDRLERARQERIRLGKARQEKISLNQQSPPVQIDVKPIRETKDLCGELIIQAHEAVLGAEKQIRYLRDGEVIRVAVKIPRGVAPGTKIRYRGLGIRGNPPGDLFLIVRVAEDPLRRVA